MPKRKRSAEPTLLEKLEKYEDEVFRALKAAKGFERQRLAKRTRDNGVSDDKKEKLNREIETLRSLDLHQTARSHLYSSLLKVKSIAASTNLPDEVRTSVAKPELSPEERTALHNVTSGLYNREPVKQAVERSVSAVCALLDLPLPGKAKRARKDKDAPKAKEPESKATKESRGFKRREVESEEESAFEGFESDVDEPGPAVGELDSEAEAKEEAKLSKYNDLMASSSDEDQDMDEDELLRKLKGRSNVRETVNLDDISDSGSDTDLGSLSEASSRSASPVPKKTARVKEEKKKKEAKPARSGKDDRFLPSLMGGYVSGSESASDVDVAPPKKRLGQRQRQAIAEKKYGANAKHVQNQPTKGRDGGWDAKRGAVEGGDRPPWKKGGARQSRDTQEEAPVKEAKPMKRDDAGTLHPSWEARKKAKDAQQTIAFEGSKITFD